MGEPPDDYCTYFTTRFPTLFLTVFFFVTHSPCCHDALFRKFNIANIDFSTFRKQHLRTHPRIPPNDPAPARKTAPPLPKYQPPPANHVLAKTPPSSEPPLPPPANPTPKPAWGSPSRALNHNTALLLAKPPVLPTVIEPSTNSHPDLTTRAQSSGSSTIHPSSSSTTSADPLKAPTEHDALSSSDGAAATKTVPVGLGSASLEAPTADGMNADDDVDLSDVTPGEDGGVKGGSVSVPAPMLVGWQVVETDEGYFEEYPQNPGGPVCQFFVSTGHCKYGSLCFKNHPAEYAVRRNQQGLPLRPGIATECQFYMTFGTCKFGQACKFHHPDIEPLYAGAALPGGGM